MSTRTTSSRSAQPPQGPEAELASLLAGGFLRLLRRRALKCAHFKDLDSEKIVELSGFTAPVE